MSNPTSNPTMYAVGGAVQASDGLYVSRNADEELLNTCRAMRFAYVLTTRQVGKSSLMVRTASRLLEEGTKCVLIDLNRIGVKLSDEKWYLSIVATIQRQLELEMDAIAWWKSSADLSITERFATFLQEVLSRVKEPVVIFVDEIDNTRALPFGDDFYAVIRSIYHSRVQIQEFNRLSFVLVGLANPADLIQNPLLTPFNIGHRVELTDFTLDEARPLADGLGPSNSNALEVLQRLLYWTGGHPYLTLKLCRAIAVEEKSRWSIPEVDEVVARTFFGEGGDQDHNLQFVAKMLTKQAPDLEGVLTTYRRVLRGWRPIRDEEPTLIKTHLKLSGVVRRKKNTLRMRNQIYRKVFDEQWIKEHLPINWPRRLTRMAASLIAVFVILSIPLAIYAWEKKRAAEVAQKKTEQALKQTESALQDSEENRLLIDVASKNLEIEKRKVDKFLASEKEAREVAVGALTEARKQKAALQTALNNYERANQREIWNRQASVALEMGDLQTAESNFNQLLLNDPNLKAADSTWLRYNLGTVHRQLGNYEKAIKFYEDALDDQASAKVNSHAVRTAALNKLAQVSREQGDYGGAERRYKQLLDVLASRRVSTVNKHFELNLMSDIAGLYQDQGQDNLAAAAQTQKATQNIEFRIRFSEPDAPGILSSDKKLEGTCLGGSMTPEKREQTLTWCRQELTALKNNVVEFQERAKSKYHDALQLHEKVVRGREEDLPSVTGDLASAYNNLAKFYESQAQILKLASPSTKDDVPLLKEASELSELARVIRQNQPSKKDDFNTQVEKIEKVAEEYDKQDKYGQAASLFVRLLDLKKEKGLNPAEQFTLLQELSTLYYKKGQDEAGKRYLDEALSLIGKPGLNDPNAGWFGLLHFLNEDLLRAMLEAKRFGAAEEFLNRVINFGKDLPPTDADKRKEAISILVFLMIVNGNVRVADERLTAAEQQYTQSLDLANQYIGSSELDSFTKFFLAKLYLRQERYTEANVFLKYVRSVYEKHLKAPNPTAVDPTDLEFDGFDASPEIYLEALSGLALINSKQGNNNEAEALYKELLTKSIWIIRSYSKKGETQSSSEARAYTEDEIVDNANEDSLSKDDRVTRNRIRNIYPDFLEQAAEFYLKIKNTNEAASLKSRANRLRKLLGDKTSENLPWPF